MQIVTKYLDLEIIKRLGNLQYNIYNEIGKEVDSMITFIFNDVNIVNPFLDESGSYGVDPIEYYGEAFLNSGWNQIVKYDY